MPTITKLTQTLGATLIAREWKLATAESCTGGGVAHAITETAGSSNWFDRGFVTYSNAAKEELLHVKPATLAAFGAVSEETAREMAEGALQHSQAQVTLAITGIAGPSGGTVDKPVGLVWFAFAGIDKETQTVMKQFSGDRKKIREQAIQFALEQLVRFTD